MPKLFKLIFILILINCILLSGCSHKRIKHDGPPDFYVDETKIKDALPKVEKLAKYGNMPSYVVFGKRYYTMKNAHKYVAVGTASWYGTSFHAQKTSSGEPYNMLAMTAAHKTLPLPTYVEVTNLNNHKKIIVKVNDRGPFVSDRLIDLSYVAAKKLDMIGHGTTRVKIRAIDPTQFGKTIEIAKNKTLINRSKSVTTKYHAPLYLQVGAFREKEHALSLRTRLVTLFKEPIHISENDRLYKVKMGPFRDIATRDHATVTLEHLGISSNKTP